MQNTPGKAADSTAFRNVALVDCSDVTTAQEPGETDDDATEDADETADPPDRERHGTAKATHPASTGKGHGTTKGSTTKASKAKGSKTKGSKGRSAAPGRH